MILSNCHSCECGDFNVTSPQKPLINKSTFKFSYKLGFEPLKLTPSCTKQARP